MKQKQMIKKKKLMLTVGGWGGLSPEIRAEVKRGAGGGEGALDSDEHDNHEQTKECA